MDEPQETKAKEYCRVLGADAAPLYQALENEYFWLRLKWQEYLAIFGSSSRVDILNETAPAYFQLIQDSLSDDILMHIARLTDPAGEGQRQNLSLARLPMALGESDATVGILVATAMSRAQFAREWRNRRLAHRDLALALGSSVKPLPMATRSTIADAVDAFHEIFAHISETYFAAHLEAEVIEAPGGAEGLLHALWDALKYREQELQRLQDGIWDPLEDTPLPD